MQGVFLGRGDDVDEALQAQLAIVNQTEDSQIPANGMAQGMHELGRAMGQEK
jgi:hypothetical protein